MSYINQIQHSTYTHICIYIYRYIDTLYSIYTYKYIQYIHLDSGEAGCFIQNTRAIKPSGIRPIHGAGIQIHGFLRWKLTGKTQGFQLEKNNQHLKLQYPQSNCLISNCLDGWYQQFDFNKISTWLVFRQSNWLIMFNIRSTSGDCSLWAAVGMVVFCRKDRSSRTAYPNQLLFILIWVSCLLLEDLASQVFCWLNKCMFFVRSFNHVQPRVCLPNAFCWWNGTPFKLTKKTTTTPAPLVGLPPLPARAAAAPTTN